MGDAIKDIYWKRCIRHLTSLHHWDRMVSYGIASRYCILLYHINCVVLYRLYSIVLYHIVLIVLYRIVSYHTSGWIMKLPFKYCVAHWWLAVTGGGFATICHHQSQLKRTIIAYQSAWLINELMSNQNPKICFFWEFLSGTAYTHRAQLMNSLCCSPANQTKDCLLSCRSRATFISPAVSLAVCLSFSRSGWQRATGSRCQLPASSVSNAGSDHQSLLISSALIPGCRFLDRALAELHAINMR